MAVCCGLYIVREDGVDSDGRGSADREQRRRTCLAAVGVTLAMMRMYRWMYRWMADGERYVQEFILESLSTFLLKGRIRGHVHISELAAPAQRPQVRAINYAPCSILSLMIVPMFAGTKL